jgi:hypothetical protein
METLARLNSTRPRRKHDFYETPIELCKEAIQWFIFDENINYLKHVLDPGAGNGVWGKALMNWYVGAEILPEIVGVESQEIKKPSCYDAWVTDDYLHYQDGGDYELVIGNPPYSLAEEFVRKSFELLTDDGYVYFLLRLAFLESKKRYFGLFNEFPLKRVYVLSRRPSFFSSVGNRKTTDALSYAMFLWQKGWQGQTELDWLYWDYDGRQQEKGR